MNRFASSELELHWQKHVLIFFILNSVLMITTANTKNNNNTDNDNNNNSNKELIVTIKSKSIAIAVLFFFLHPFNGPTAGFFCKYFINF